MNRNLAARFLPLLVLFAGCAALPRAERPGWLARPKSGDGAYLYYDGHAVGGPAPEGVREAAFRDAVRQVENSFVAQTASPASRSALNVASDVEPVPDGYHFEPAGMGRFEAWIRVSYPTSAGDRIRRRIAEGRQLSELWAQASALQGRRDYASAIPLVQRIIQSWRDPLFAGFTLPDARTRMDDLLKLQRGAEISARWAEAVRCEQQGALREATEHLKALLKEYDAGLGLSFNLADVQLKLGDLYAEQKDFLEARRCYDAVRKSAPSRTADAARRLARLPAPPRLWPLNDRWGGGKVALLCSIRDENGSRAFGALAGRLTKDCGEARIPVLDISSSVPGAEAAAAFDNRAFTPAVDLARRQGAGVLLAVLFDIDPARRGKTEVHFGEAMPAVDSRVRFFVLKTADGSVLYTDQFKEIAGTSTSDRLAERAATIMVNNYLVPKCPAVK